ncbi:hypothetical protein GCM10022409_30330 [Hymenobacter glaciei]|uniref:Beta-ketoacyl synthase N-terminal domain-containing protein n=1 Tax=Hymenobacter glaciei TaxID=877209 RepID=A0ABP7UFF1_9BACT
MHGNQVRVVGHANRRAIGATWAGSRTGHAGAVAAAIVRGLGGTVGNAKDGFARQGYEALDGAAGTQALIERAAQVFLSVGATRVNNQDFNALARALAPAASYAVVLVGLVSARFAAIGEDRVVGTGHQSSGSGIVAAAAAA